MYCVHNHQKWNVDMENLVLTDAWPEMLCPVRKFKSKGLIGGHPNSAIGQAQKCLLLSLGDHSLPYADIHI